MHNLFVINTPMQLLSAYIIANSIEQGNQNQLIILHPSGFEFWDKTVCLNHMAQDKETWQQINVVKNWLNRDTKMIDHKKQIKSMKQIVFQNGPVDQVFLGSDKIIQNQLMVELAGKNSYARIDEGLGSYNCRDRHWASKIWQRIRIKYFKSLGGLNAGMKYNLSGIGYGESAFVDYLFKPELLGRPSPNPVRIDRSDVHKSLEKLTKRLSPLEPLSRGNCVVFLSSPCVEFCWYSKEQEVEVLKELHKIVERYGLRLVYKTHPAEDYGKLNFYKSQLPVIEFFESVEPIEVLYYKHEKIKFVMSYASSGMLFAEIFGRHNITSAALFRIYNTINDYANWKPAMAKANINIPNNWYEVENIFKRYKDNE